MDGNMQSLGVSRSTSLTPSTATIVVLSAYDLQSGVVTALLYFT